MNAVFHGFGGLTLAALFCRIAVAGEYSSANAGDGATAAIPSVSTQAPARNLAPGVADIVKMESARVGDSVILAYIDNAGTVYNLDANQIVYLHDMGISEPVISAMLNQKQKYMAQAARMAAQNPPMPSAYGTPPSSQAVYSQPDSQEAPGSTVYVIPYQTAMPYYGYSYYPYYSYSVGYPWFYGGVGFDRFHRHGFGVRAGFANRFGGQPGFRSSSQGQIRGGVSSGSHGSFQGRR